MRLFWRARQEREMREELQLHVQREADALVERGQSREEAERSAARLFGNLTAVRQECRETRGFQWLENFRRDLGYGLRGLRRTPAFSTVAVLSLALGIGVNAAVFSVVHAFLLQPLDVPHAERLALLRIERPAAVMHGLVAKDSYDFSYPTFEYLRRENREFSGLFATGDDSFTYQTWEGTRQVPGAWVSADYFSVLHIKPQMGSLLRAAENKPGDLLVDISDAFWSSAFGRDPKAVGKILRLNGHDVTIAGVLPPQFHGVTIGEQPAIFAPLATEPLLNSPYSSVSCGEGCDWLTVMGRLKDGESLSRARAALRVVSQQYFTTQSVHGLWGNTRQEVLRNHFGAISGATGFSFLRQRFADPLQILLWLSLLVLATTCANLAALLLARSAARQREFSVRGALGASRSRLIAQILTETSLIAAAGALLGIPLMYALSQWLANSLFPDSESFRLSLEPNAAILFFVLGITFLTTLSVGLSPALRLTGRSSMAGSRIILVERRNKLVSRILLTGQVGLSLLLVVAAVVFSGSLFQLRQVHLGFNPDHLVVIGSSWSKSKKTNVQKQLALEQILEALRSSPRVKSAAILGMLPLSGNARITTISAPPSQRKLELFDNDVSPQYFATMGTRLLEGRDFTDSPEDQKMSVVLSKKAADFLFSDRSAVGQVIQEGELKPGKQRRVIGVVENSKYLNLRNSEATIFHPNEGWASTFVVRYTGDVHAVLSLVEKQLRRVAPEVPLGPPVSMQHLVDKSLATERLFATLSNFFGGLALLLMAVGLYGTLAYTTARRTPEIGIRMALGATRRSVLWTVARENLLVVAAGVVLGLGAAAASVRFIRSLVYGVDALDPRLLLAVCGLIGAAAAMATILPAWRAARIDPMAALRENN